MLIKNSGIYNLMPDGLYLKMQYRRATGEQLDLKHPRTINEKLQWLKLHNRDPLYTRLVDKVEVKKIVSDLIGEEHVIPTLAVWNSADEIDYDSLPDRFVIKCSHDSGGVFVCRDKNSFNREHVREELRARLKHNFYWDGREWPYKNVPRRIIAEQFLDEGNNSDLTDYKILCFNGEPKYCQVITDRRTDEKIDFFDMDWNLQPFQGVAKKPHNSNLQKPAEFETMKRIARILSAGKCYARIDLYTVKDRVYFGEITFFPAAGFGSFAPPEWNRILGDMIDLTKAGRRTLKGTGEH